MAQLNKKVKTPAKRTHEGAVAYRIDALQELRRTSMACLLWEDTFYETGVSIADRIKALVPQVRPEDVAAVAVEAREKMKLRHLPLLLVYEMTKLATHKHVVAETLARVIQRPDELTEFCAIYMAGRELKSLKKLSKQVRKGLALAFQKFNAYSLAKYNRDGAVKLRDVLFLCHPKPLNAEQAEVWKKLADKKLESPDTWEVALSAGANKKETFERLIAEKKLGGLAFLRNLRGMIDAGVDEKLMRAYFEVAQFDRVLPFRFVSAAIHAPKLEDSIQEGMLRCLAEFPKLPGKTAIVVDNSGSMEGAKVSAKSEMDRSDAACALAILVREVCESVVVIGFGSDAAVIPPRRGFALREAIKKGPGGGTKTDHALALAAKEKYDRIIVITDEQSHQSIRGPLPESKGYFINVATHQNGIGYGKWTHIDGWSEAILSYIQAAEGMESSPEPTE